MALLAQLAALLLMVVAATQDAGYFFLYRIQVEDGSSRRDRVSSDNLGELQWNFLHLYTTTLAVVEL